MAKVNSYTQASKRKSEEMKLYFVASSTKKTKYEMQLRRQFVNKAPPRDLFSFCRNENWRGFIKVCQEQPQNCTWISPYGQNLLHFICQRHPSVESINTFLELCPEALMQADIDGNLPIHMAMTNGASKDALCLLIQKAPKSVNMRNRWGYAPFEWIWERCLYELATLDGTGATRTDTIIKKRIWNIIEVLVRAVVRDYEKSERTILHMITEFDCPLSLLQAIVHEYPSMLLQEYQGRIPLHLAIDRNKEWSTVLKVMVEAAPDCIRTQDGVTNLYPFMLLSSKSRTSLTDLDEAIAFCVDIFNEEWKHN